MESIESSLGQLHVLLCLVTVFRKYPLPQVTTISWPHYDTKLSDERALLLSSVEFYWKCKQSLLFWSGRSVS